MRLDVYRSCTWREKRAVLDVFWRTNRDGSGRIREAALEYGRYAVGLVAVVAVEMTLIMAVAFGRAYWFAWLTGVLDVFALTSTWWAQRRYRTLHTETR